jgi:hypothetical protein
VAVVGARRLRETATPLRDVEQECGDHDDGDDNDRAIPGAVVTEWGTAAEAGEELYRCGSFGKGSLSRSRPTFGAASASRRRAASPPAGAGALSPLSICDAGCWRC